MRIVNGENPYNSDGESEEGIRINSCGLQSVQETDYNYTTYREAGRLDYQMLYLWKGCGFFELEEGVRQIEEGGVVLYKPRQRQKYTYHAKDRPEAYWIHFTGRDIPRMLKSCGLWESQSFMVGSCPEFGELIGRIVREIRLKPFQYELLCGAYFTELLALVGRRKQRYENVGLYQKYDRIAAVIETIQNHCEQNASVEDYARQANLSKYHFIHLFTQLVGQSPYAYKTGVRLEKAKELLANTNLPVSEVARLVGYENPLYFSRIFKSAAGQPPLSYRRDQQYHP